METTGRFDLPLIMPNQAQKHVTHNEALTLIDGLCHLVIKSFGQASPPPAALIDEAFVIGANATGLWFGEDGNIAFNTDTGWRFIVPRQGIIALDSTTSKLVIFNQGVWSPLGNAVELSSSPQFGINTPADATNRLALRSNAALLTALNVGDGGNGDMQLKINKEVSSDTASLLYQTGFSGRAELGLAGDDDFRLKVSADGSTWNDALLINKTTGVTTLANNSVSNAALTDMPTARFKGRAAAGVGDPQDITGTQATALLDVFSTSLKGLTPASGGGTANYLRADGTWAAPNSSAAAWGGITGTLTSQADLALALDGTKNASNLNTGTIADAQLPSRLRASPQAVATPDLANQTGTYVCNFILPEISASTQWYIIETIAWGTTYLTQRAFAVAIDTPADTRAAYRETNGVATIWTSWSRVLISRDEMDLRYAIAGANLTLNSNASVPAFPAVDSLRLHARRRAGADFLEYVLPNGREMQLQSHLGWKNTAQWAPSAGSTVYTRGITRTSVGTASTPVLASTNFVNSLRRWRVTSAATASSVCDERSPATVCWRGNAPGLGGFLYTNRIALVTLQTGSVAFFGLMASVAALATTQTLAAMVNCVGIGFTSGTHSNWQVILNDGTATPTLIDMGTNFPVANFTNVYTLVIFSSPNGASVGVRVTCENTGAVFEQDLTTKIPANTTFLSVRNFLHNGGVAAAVAYDCSGVYLETDF